jgi:hypothetical protein
MVFAVEKRLVGMCLGDLIPMGLPLGVIFGERADAGICHKKSFSGIDVLYPSGA